MKVWMLALPVLGVLLVGCGRRAPEPVGNTLHHGATGPVVTAIVIAEPSPAGDQVAFGLSPRGAASAHTSLAASPESVWLLDLRTGASRRLWSTSDPGEQQSLMSEQGSRGSLFWQPGGGSLAFAWLKSIEVFDLTRGATHSISLDGLRAGRPVWSPDGKRLFFEAYGWPDHRDVTDLYAAPADGSAPPRPEAVDQTSDLWLLQTYHWSPRRSTGAADTPRQRRADDIGRATASACSPDRQRLAYSGVSAERKAARLAVVDRSLKPFLLRQDLESPAYLLRWSPDGKQLLARNASQQTFLLDPAQKMFVLITDPLLVDKDPVGWVRWEGKWQLAFLDGTRKRLVITERIGTPVRTLVTLKDDGSPTIALAVTKEK